MMIKIRKKISKLYKRSKNLRFILQMFVAFLSAIIAFSGGSNIIQSWWNSSVGEKNVYQEKINQLGYGVGLNYSYVKQVLGEPVLIYGEEDGERVSYFQNKYFDVQLFTSNQTVYAINFLSSSGILFQDDIVAGRTKLSDLSQNNNFNYSGGSIYSNIGSSQYEIYKLYDAVGVDGYIYRGYGTSSQFEWCDKDLVSAELLDSQGVYGAIKPFEDESKVNFPITSSVYSSVDIKEFELGSFLLSRRQMRSIPKIPKVSRCNKSSFY